MFKMLNSYALIPKADTIKGDILLHELITVLTLCL